MTHLATAEQNNFLIKKDIKFSTKMAKTKSIRNAPSTKCSSELQGGYCINIII